MASMARTLACLLVAVLACSSTSMLVQGQKHFNSVFYAMLALPDLKIIQQTYMSMVQSRALETTSGFKPILDLAMNQTANATFFWPQDAAWADLSQQLCLPVPAIQSIMVSFPPIAASYMSLVVVPGRTIFRRDFRDGEGLITMNSTFTLPLTLRKAPDGSSKWLFPGLAFNHSDVTIVNYDIVAGNAVIHFVDTAFVDDSQRSFWTVQRDMACRNANNSNISTSPAPETATAVSSSGSQSGRLSPGVVAAIAIPCTVAALLAAALLYMQHAKLRRRRQQQQQQQHGEASDAFGFAVPGAGAGAGGAGAGGAGGCSLLVAPGPQDSRPFTSDSANSGHGALSDAAYHGDADQHQPPQLPAFEPSPAVPPEKLQAWLQLQGKGRWGGAAAGAAAAAAAGGGGGAAGAAGAVGDSGTSTDSSGGSTDSSRAMLQFAEQIARDLDPVHGNPNIKDNMTNFVRKSLHSRTAVYFADGLHNPRKYALKFYADAQACAAERDAYRELQGAQNKHIPVLEVAYVECPGSPYTSFCLFEQGNKCLEEFAQQQPNYYKLIDVFHQLLTAVQYLHDHGRVHLDLKPQNVVQIDRAGGAWMLIDLATSARIGEEARLVYTRNYCSPEVAQAVLEGRSTFVAQPATDMWGVGVIMYQLVTGQPFFPASWSEDGRLWSALCGFERLPSELHDLTALPGVDPSFKGIMRQVRRLLQRKPGDRPTAQVLLLDRLFQARNTITQVSQGSSTLSHASLGSSAAAASASGAPAPAAPS